MEELASAKGFFEAYQEILGSIVGFSGVCITIWAAHMSSKRLQRDAHHREVDGLRSGLTGELCAIKVAVSTVIAQLGQAIGKPTVVAIPDFRGYRRLSVVYETNTAKLHLLTDTEIMQLVLFYAGFSEFVDDMEHELASLPRTGSKLTIPIERGALVEILIKRLKEILGGANNQLFFLDVAMKAPALLGEGSDQEGLAKMRDLYPR